MSSGVALSVATLACLLRARRFGVSSGEPRSTELTEMVQALAVHGVYQHPALQRPGYWHEDTRLKYGIRSPAVTE